MQCDLVFLTLYLWHEHQPHVLTGILRRLHDCSQLQSGVVLSDDHPGLDSSRHGGAGLSVSV